MSDDFPLDSFKDAAIHLRRPFTPQAVKFKVQATWPKDEPTSGMIVSYIDARLAVERLNLIVPHLWYDNYEPADKPRFLRCALTIDGITRSDVGEGDGKGLYSDAFKRAAVKFGVGVSIYAVPKMVLNVRDGHLQVKGSGERQTVVLTANGETRARDIYSLWLATHGTQAFGEVLNHGDVENSQGDVDAEASADAPPEDPPERIAADVEALRALIREVGWTTRDVKMNLAAVGVQNTADVDAALEALTPDEATAFRAEISRRKAALPT